MLTLRSGNPPELPGPDESRQDVGFVTTRPAGATRTALLRVTDVSRLHEPTTRRELSSVVGGLARQGRSPELEICGIARGDDLVLAAVVALAVHLKAPEVPISLYADRRQIHDELLRRFERAMSQPTRLLKTLEHATFARMHFLVGQGDHDAIEAFAPLLDFVGMIADGDPMLAQQLARRLDIQKRNLQIMVTRRCHLRCVYCPIDKRLETDRHPDTSLDDARRALELLLRSDNEAYRLDFTGGEPLLRKAWVRQMMEYSRQRARETGKRDSYYLVTNAIELDDDFCRFLSDYDMELEVSIDGDERSHNRNTTAVIEGINPYQALLQGFEHLQRHDIRYNAVLVFTPEGFERLRDNLEHALKLGFRNISINYAIGYTWPEELIDRYAEVVAELVDRYDMLEQGERGSFFIKNLRYKSEPTVLNSELMLDTDGSLHLLSEWQFRKDCRRREPPFAYSLDELETIDQVFYTRAQVYHLLYEVYRSKDRRMLDIIHNSVATGLTVASRLRERLGQRLGQRLDER